MSRLAALVLVAALLGGAAVARSSSPKAVADAHAVTGTLGTAGSVHVARDGEQTQSGPVALNGVTIRSAETIARVDISGLRGRAEAKAVARTINAFDGQVTAYGVRRRAIDDGDGGTRYQGQVNGLVIEGRQIGDVGESRTYDLKDGAGQVVVNSGATGLRITRKDGTEVRIAVVETSARNGRADPTPTATPTPEPTATPKPDQPEKEKDKKAEEKRDPPIPGRLYGEQFVFPVGDSAQFSDDWGAPRQIGAHQGNDVFGAFGAPVVAVADGEIFKVGTLPISGNRLWLRDDNGDEFFYAHLSTFSPKAVNGRRVKAGTVLGYLGNTGDAEPTPPHVHFQIHPGGGDPINPYKVLQRWQERSSASADTTERPGALVEVRDFIAGE